MNRRNFIKRSFSATAGVGLIHLLQQPINAMNLQSKYLDTIGLQLWTVRNQLNEDKQKTLKAVKAAGYKQVELMDVGQADDLLPICKDLGLNVTSSFIDWNSICNPSNKNTPTIDSIIEKAASHKLEHLVFGYIGKGSRETVDQFKQYSWRANDAGIKCKKVGIQLCYHNHSFEFGKLNDGKTTGWDVLVKHLDHDAVKFELDVFGPSRRP